MSNYDHYVEAKIIADQIEAEGFIESADALRDAIENGRSGTEIFMQLRFYLSPLQDNNQISRSTRDRIKVLLSKVNETLAP